MKVTTSMSSGCACGKWCGACNKYGSEQHHVMPDSKKVAAETYEKAMDYRNFFSRRFVKKV